MPETASLTAVEWVIIGVLVVSTLISLWRGFVKEALSLAGCVVAFLVANIFVDQMASLLAGAIDNITGRYVAAYAILFVGTLVVSTFVTYLAGQVIKVTGLSVLDRVLGTVFGFARGVILILVCVFVLRQLLPPGDLTWLDQSILMPHVDMLAQWVRDVFSASGSGQWPTIST
ncbi:MAG: CvpA family protein [Pseudomonadota bacterium]